MCCLLPSTATPNRQNHANFHRCQQAIDPIDCNLEEEPFGAEALTMDQAFTHRIESDFAGTADRAAVLLAGDSFVADTALEFRGGMFETFDPLSMVKRAGHHPESLHVTGCW